MRMRLRDKYCQENMKKELLYLGIAAAMLAGCSTRSKLTKGNVVEESAPDRVAVVTEKVKLNPVGDPETEKRQQVWNEQKAAMGTEKKSDQRYARRPRKERQKMMFTSSQSSYLQIPGINPLPVGGVLELDFDAMALDFYYPVEGVLLSPYGRRGASTHTGMDIKALPNDTIRAAFPGVVRMAKSYSSYGNLVAIRHYEGFETVYAHGSKILVKVNDVVEPGDPIMLAGRTGRATTEHLHFEVRAGDGHIDPARVIDPYNRALRSGKLYITELNGKIVAYADDLELEQLKSSKSATLAQVQKPAETAQPVRPVQPATPSRPVAPAQPAKPASPTSQNTVKPEVNIVMNAVAEAPGAAVYYRVKKGDTLSAIARNYNTTVAKICQLSNIKPNAILQINQRLRVK